MNNEKKSSSFNKKRLKIGSYGIVVTVVVIALAVIVNMVMSALPTTVTHLNTDNVDFYEISDETRAFLDRVDTDITFYLIAEKGNEDAMIGELLSRYEALSSHVKIKNIDPVTNPTFTAKYTDEKLNPNSVIAESSLRSFVIDYNEIYTKQYSDEELQYMAYGYQPTGTTYFNGEMMFTSAVDYVTRESLPTVYMLTGHGEAELDATYSEYLSKENIETASLNLLNGDIPDDCSAVVLCSPESDITAAEAEKLMSYMDRGGNIVLLTSILKYDTESMPNVAALAAEAGLESADGIIWEEDVNRYYQANYMLVPEIVTDSAVSSLLSSTRINVLFNGAHGIVESESKDENITVNPLLRTSDKAIVKELGDDGSTIADKEGESERSLMVGALSEITKDSGTSRFLWYSSDSLIDINIANVVGTGNINFFTASLNLLCDKSVSVSILGKSMNIDPLTIAEGSGNLWMTVMTVLVPVAVLGGGFAFWFSRRRK
ncbi:MAG: hypothetical protein HFE30_05620 [Clostridiales bacterium]|nr:hypothetical protein [Clostridiales bacterium]